MADPEDSLVSRRSRRSTAGNRYGYFPNLIPRTYYNSMEAALAEMALDTTEKDVENDNDFVNEKGSLPHRSFTVENTHWDR